MVPLLLIDDDCRVLVPVPVCLVTVPVLVNVLLLESELSPLMVIIPLLVIGPVPEIVPSFQIRLPFTRIRSDAFKNLVPFVFTAMLCPAPIVNGRASVPPVQVMSALMVNVPA